MLHTQTLCALAALLHLAASQPAPGIALQADAHTLEVTYGTNAVSPAGKLMPRAELLQPPTLRAANLPNSPRGPFVLVMVDSDVPRNNSRVPLLHWLSSNITLSPNATLVVPPAQKQEAPYIAPNPPAGDSPHAYSFLLYAAPASGLAIPASFNFSNTQQRIFTSENALVSFMGNAGIKGKALAANYMEVQNKSASATGSFPPPRATGAAGNGTNGGGNGGRNGGGNGGGNGGRKNGTLPFEGGAWSGRGVGGGIWLGVVGTAVGVGMAAVML